MTRRISLSAKILLLALLNALILIAAFLLFVHLHLGFDFGSVLLSGARDRVISASRGAALELTDAPRDQWSELLKGFSSRYPARFYLFSEEGSEIAGERVNLPATFAEGLRRHQLRRAGAEAEPPPPPPPPAASSLGTPLETEPPLAPHPVGGQPGFGRPRGEFGPNPPLRFSRSGDPPEYWVGVPIPIRLPGADEPLHSVLVWRIHSLWLERFYFDVHPWLIIVGLTLFVPMVCWIPFIRAMTGAISRMTVATGQIANGHFDITLPATRRDELGILGESINRMAGRLAGYVHGQKRFLGDIAHELSSPIARMQLALGILEQRVAGSAGGYVGDVREEVEQMSSLVNELLQFSRSGAARQLVKLEAIELRPLVERVVNREGTPESVIRVEMPGDVWVTADGDCLFRAMANVVRNAVRYAGKAGPIMISAGSAAEERVAIHVVDCGPGVPASELENVFRPFYRPEFARTRETGGTGLGLAIVRDCVESCGGVVSCRNRTPHGFHVTIELAAAAVASGSRLVGS